MSDTSITNLDKDFPQPTQYEQTYVRNESWSNTTTTKVEPDGSKVQTFFIMPSRRR
jgi:hypothetical protein